MLDGLRGGSPASYAIRFAAGFPGMLMVLSGMSSLSQMEGNIAFMRDFRPLDERELAAVKCGRCEKVCPQHLPIRRLLEDVAKKFEKEAN